jgi:hypothetical protein
MTDSEPPQIPNVVFAEGYPREDLPVYFVDILTSAAKGPGFIKTYIARIDPKVDGTPGAKVTPIAQLVFAFPALVNALAFLELQVEGLVKQGDIEEGTLDATRKTLRAGLGIV